MDKFGGILSQGDSFLKVNDLAPIMADKVSIYASESLILQPVEFELRAHLPAPLDEGC
jgi:hypothetical protein